MPAAVAPASGAIPTRKTYAGPLLVGEDLTTISIGETVEVGRAR